MDLFAVSDAIFCLGKNTFTKLQLVYRRRKNFYAQLFKGDRRSEDVMSYEFF